MKKSKLLSFVAIELLLVLCCALLLVLAFGVDQQRLMSALFGSRLSFNEVHLHQLQFLHQQCLFMAVAIMVLGTVVNIFWARIRDIFREGLISRQPSPPGYLWLFGVSFLSLFFEVIFIRWFSSEVRIFAFFKNVSLIAAFLGIGLGCLIARRQRRYELLFIPGLALLLIAITAGSDTYLRLISFAGATVFGEDHAVWGHSFSQALYPLAVFLFYGGLAVLFSVQVLIFIPLGHLVGRGFMNLPRIPAYSINIGGALAGIFAYDLLANLCTPPWVWFLLGSIPLLWLIRDRRKELLISSVLLLLALAGQFHTVFPRIWSPYNRLSITDSFIWRTPTGLSVTYPSEPAHLRDVAGKEGEWVHIGKRIDVNDLFYMDVTDFSDKFLSRYPGLYGDVRLYMYNLPFTILNPRRICIVGSGGGNDVAAALRAGVDQVTAVEIDSVIAQIGLEHHPEKPYEDERVQLVIDDARHFFNSTDEKFDLVIFGLLDSHSLFSTFSSVRLDNYVYTVEAFERVKEILTPDGSVVCTFAVKQPWMTDRFELMLQQVFGKQPIVVDSGRGIMFITGNRTDYAGLVNAAGMDTLPEDRDPAFANLPIPSDDWPFLYQKNRTIPVGILLGLLLMVCIGSGWTLWLLPAGSRVPKGYGQYFWLGVSFLLVQTKSISQLALVWGSTWKVTAIVIGTIMLLILLSNLLVLRLRIRRTRWAYMLLLVSLLGSFLYDLEWALGEGLLLGRLVPTFVLLVPLFFAGVVFITLFQNERRAEAALGWNLMGGVLGGFLEYSSVILGFSVLAPLAIGTYSLSWLLQKPRPEADPGMPVED